MAKVRVGLIGIGGMGGCHFYNYEKIPNAELVAVCDVRENVAKEKVGERRISLDYSAFFRPLKAARFLLKQGFCIDGIYMKDIDTEDEDYRWFTENTDIQIIKVNGADMVNKWKTKGEGIAIGMEAAYVTGSEHVVVMFQDEEMYGYHGVCRLMKMLCDCLEEKTDLEQTIQRIGLVV